MLHLSSVIATGLLVGLVPLYSEDFWSKVKILRHGIASLTRIIDEFLESIGAMIPQIISLLSKKHWDARLLGAKVLAKLSKQGKQASCDLILLR